MAANATSVGALWNREMIFHFTRNKLQRKQDFPYEKSPLTEFKIVDTLCLAFVPFIGTDDPCCIACATGKNVYFRL